MECGVQNYHTQHKRTYIQWLAYLGLCVGIFTRALNSCFELGPGLPRHRHDETVYRLAALFWGGYFSSCHGTKGEATNYLEIPHQPITNQFNSQIVHGWLNLLQVGR